MGFLENQSTQPNEIELAKKKRLRKGLPLIDLTDTNPTTNGFIFPNEILLDLADKYLRERVYQPDPKGLYEARRAVANYYSQRSPALDISPEWIFLTASTSEAYSLVFSLLCSPGDNLLAPSVTYPLFDLLAEHQHVTLKHYRLLENMGWAAAESDLSLTSGEQTRGLIIVSPHNPTGKVHSTRLAEIARLDLPIICDEVFAEFTCSASAAPPLGALYPELPVFHLNGISKMFALPDMKLGWIALNQRAFSLYGDRLEILNDCFLSANSLAQHMLERIFQTGLDFAAGMRLELNKRMDSVLDLLLSCRRISLTKPEGAYFLFPRIDAADEDKLMLKLIERGVFTHPGYFYGLDDGCHLVISCLKDKGDLLSGTRILLNLLNE